VIAVGVAFLFSLGAGAPCAAAKIDTWLEKNLEPLIALYQHFHRNPELSFQEKETGERLAAELKTLGFETTTRVGGHGVVALLKNGDGPTVMIRTDLDALPVTEDTGLAYASKVKVRDATGREVGVMHACGHDLHITNLIGTAKYLSEHKNEWKGRLMLIGQPAEERGSGAKAMLADGLFMRFPKPDYAIALHCDPALATGQIACRPGFICANVDSVDITIRGRGGHGAWPHMTIDPIVIAAKLVLDLQTIVSRELKPDEPAVVTVGSIHGGSKHNIIGDTCTLQLTIRSYTNETREEILSAIRRKAAAAAASAGAPEPEVTENDTFTPALKNDEAITERITATLRKALGDERVELAERSMGGEDFSQYGLAGVPICMFRLGTTDPMRIKGLERLKEQPPSLHSPRYYPDAEEALATGIRSTTAAAFELFRSRAK
jgi:hippurate hydrolase